jgi:WD40 repeat protein
LGRDDQTLIVRDAKTGRELLHVRVPGRVNRVSRSTHKADWWRYRKAFIRSIEADKNMHTLAGHAARVRGVAFCRDGRLLASADEQGAIRI